MRKNNKNKKDSTSHEELSDRNDENEKSNDKSNDNEIAFGKKYQTSSGQEINKLKDSIYYVNLWYDSFQKMNRFFAALALGIIFFTATFLLNTIIGGRNIQELNLVDMFYIKWGA